MSAAQRLLVLVIPLALLAGGCGRRHPFSQAELDRARGALETSLEAWKKNEGFAGLRKLPEPISFVEEWPRKGIKLLEYEILGDTNTDADGIRFTVKLKVQDLNTGRREDRQVTYAVALKSPIVIGRDPYF
jgi:hypothetical protein